MTELISYAASIDWLTLGYTGIFIISFLESLAVIGVLFPGGNVIMLAGAAIPYGFFNFIPLVVFVCLGAFVGDTLSYYIGRYYKKSRFVTHYFTNKPVYAKTQRLMNRYAVWTFLVAKTLGPLRPFTALFAGLINYSPRQFMLYNMIAIIVFGLVYVSIGYLGGYIVQLDFINMVIL